MTTIVRTIPSRSISVPDGSSTVTHSGMAARLTSSRTTTRATAAGTSARAICAALIPSGPAEATPTRRSPIA